MTPAQGLYQDGYAEVYDLLMRRRGHDHAGECRALLELIGRWRPGAHSLLDVACGTGLHLERIAPSFDTVHAADLSPEALAIAAGRVDSLHRHVVDMRRIELAERFDAITCLFAVPHLSSAAELDATVARLADHLAPGGVLIVEPWYHPEDFLPGYIATDALDEGGRSIVRLSHSDWLDRASQRIRMVVHHATADPAHGIRHATEEIDLTLFTPEQFRDAFVAAGCHAEHTGAAPFRWGLWLARRAGGGSICSTLPGT
ncbi:class I SAM-dependent methyltransferase [Pseudonocardia sp. NPDC046786]|uniref:class I SAM-dependent methyltransferase n=1 Tax=Pseudonocardia sp. NPDC046786 TaxID=3155471 RepID=UPI0033F587C9